MLRMKNLKRNSVLRTVTIIIGVIINVSLAYLTRSLELPLYFDTIGTIGVTAIAGLFPGFLTAIISNFLCGLFNPFAVYCSILNILIAGVTYYSFCYKHNKSFLKILLYILVLAVIGGGIGGVFQLLLLGAPQFESIEATANLFSSATGISFNISFLILNISINYIDKGVSVLIASIIIHFVPKQIRKEILNSGWKQKPLSADELKEYKKADSRSGRLQYRIFRLLIVTAASVTLIMEVISLQIYYENKKADYVDNAIGATKMAAGVIDPDKVEVYLRRGRDAFGYAETEQELYNIRECFAGVEYLYILVIQEDACHVVFDLETEDTPALKAGELVEFEEAFLPYVPDLLEGKEIEPVESNDISGWVMTVYEPVKNADGETVCYVCADVSLTRLTGYVRTYILKATLIFSGFISLILAYGIWVCKYYLVRPINSMAHCTNSFVYDTDNNAVLQDNVKKIKSLDIRTNDEVENLYRAICKMTEDTAEQVIDIRHQAKRINQMQTGLIITMADMVESRDSDTGFHIQKTAEYVDIILRGLKAKGYYKEKLTEKYMNDVVMSAPLHDVGKINISDTILNKPGKLTDEEYEIMKTHTTEGKKILEKAINTVQGESYLKEARNMAAYHHEKWDGSGYPEGLKGPVIPLSARIMAVADVFDALTAKRVYKDPMPYEKAMSIIKEDSGTHFDPKCVEVFVEAEAEVKKILRKYQD